MEYIEFSKFTKNVGIKNKKALLCFLFLCVGKALSAYKIFSINDDSRAFDAYNAAMNMDSNCSYEEMMRLYTKAHMSEYEHGKDAINKHLDSLAGYLNQSVSRAASAAKHLLMASYLLKHTNNSNDSKFIDCCVSAFSSYYFCCEDLEVKSHQVAGCEYTKISNIKYRFKEQQKEWHSELISFLFR